MRNTFKSVSHEQKRVKKNTQITNKMKASELQEKFDLIKQKISVELDIQHMDYLCNRELLYPTKPILFTEENLNNELKKRGYIKTINGYRLGFVFCYLKDGLIHIQHDIGASTKARIIKDPLTGLSLALDYMERGFVS